MDDFTVTGSPASGPFELVERSLDPSLLAHSLGVEIHQRIELRIEPLDLSDVLIGQFQRRDLAGAQQDQQFKRGLLRYWLHRVALRCPAADETGCGCAPNPRCCTMPDPSFTVMVWPAATFESLST